MSMSTQSVTLHQLLFVNDEGILLSSTEQDVLARLFAGYERLVVKSELGGGFGGGRVLLVRPITAVSADLPAIVKLGRAAIIQQEWEAFAHYVQRKVPKVANIEGEPQFTADSSWGGIRYPLAGDGYFFIESLGAFCRQADNKDILYVLENQLFPSLGALWQGAQPVHEYAFGRSLDAILPVNLVVTYRKLATVASAPDRERQWGVGDEVTLANLLITEADSVAGELALDLPPDENNPAGGWRIRVTAVPDAGDYQIGEILPQPITGVVAATRNTTFQTQLARIFNTPISAADSTFTLPETGSLPNPIAHLPAILKQREDVRVGTVHGDLNLENVLVEFDHKSRNIHLIDFANARRDWILHDLLRLETNVWLHVVPEEMKRNGRSISDLSRLVASLQTAVAHPNQIEIPPGLAKPFHILLAIRRQAQHLLMSPHNWDAYWQGLTV
ncbi:MAG TPA: phosphotransferase, partial [Chloroflexota bacterium]|nr:phosphotransferase [Chloroflexota bacterium]